MQISLYGQSLFPLDINQALRHDLHFARDLLEDEAA